MVKLTNGTGSAPGNWGFIAVPGNGNNPFDQIPNWSKLRPSSCQVVSPSALVNQVDTGNNGDKAAFGMNVRFDNPDNRADSNLAGPIVIDGFRDNGKTNNCANSVDKRGG